MRILDCGVFRPETSRIILKVNSNPRQLNATTMAKLLEADTTLREHANNDLGVEIASFEVGDANVSTVATCLVFSHFDIDVHHNIWGMCLLASSLS